MSGFVLREETSTFEWPVKVKWPHNGSHVDRKFTATFKIISQEEINRLMESGGSMAVLDAALISFTGIPVTAADDSEVDDLAERKRVLFQYPFVVAAVSNAYAEGITGHRPKN